MSLHRSRMPRQRLRCDVPASDPERHGCLPHFVRDLLRCLRCAPPAQGLVWFDYPYPPECDGGTWVCNEPTATEEHLFFWAYGQYSMNAWDVEVAAESHGFWDSNYGANYYARFEPVGCF